MRKPLSGGDPLRPAGPCLDWTLLAQAVGNLLAGMVRHASTLPENVAQHTSRARILHALRLRPGQNLSRISDDLQIKRQAASYHLYILERAGVVASLERPHTTHFFPPHVARGEHSALAVLRRERGLEVARVLVDEPGIGQAELLERIGMDKKVWKAYRDDFAREGLLLAERADRRIRYRPTPRLERLLTLATSEMGAHPR